MGGDEFIKKGGRIYIRKLSFLYLCLSVGGLFSQGGGFDDIDGRQGMNVLRKVGNRILDLALIRGCYNSQNLLGELGNLAYIKKGRI